MNPYLQNVGINSYDGTGDPKLFFDAFMFQTSMIKDMDEKD